MSRHLKVALFASCLTVGGFVAGRATAYDNLLALADVHLETAIAQLSAATNQDGTPRFNGKRNKAIKKICAARTFVLELKGGSEFPESDPCYVAPTP